MILSQLCPLAMASTSKSNTGLIPNDVSSKSGIQNLQPEIVLDILSRLPVLSLLRSKLVRRSWRAIVQDQHLVTLHLSRAASANPSLILHSDYHNGHKLYFVDSAHYHDREAIKKLNTPFSSSMPDQFDVVGSCNGLLCLSDTYNDVMHIYNPFTRNCVELPEATRYSNQIVVFGFGIRNNPTSMDYKVVRVTYYSHRRIGLLRGCRFTPEQSEVQILTVGSPGWRSIGKVPCHLDRWPLQVLVQGRLHWVGWRHRHRSACMVISLDLGDEEFREVPKPDCGSLDSSCYHLVVLGGCLSAAVHCDGGLEIWVMKEYGVKESWVKEFKVGNYVPKVMKEEQDQDTPFRRIQNGKVLCLLENGEIVLEYARRALVCYDPKTGRFRELVFEGLPSRFETVVHKGSFNWIDTPIHM